MAIFPLTITAANIQAGKSVSISFTDGVAAWSLASPNARVPGFVVNSVPTGQLTLADIMLSETVLEFTAGPYAGTATFQLHVDVPEGVLSASGTTETGGDMNVEVTYSTGSGLVGELMGDWIIWLD